MSECNSTALIKCGRWQLGYVQNIPHKEPIKPFLNRTFDLYGRLLTSRPGQVENQVQFDTARQLILLEIYLVLVLLPVAAVITLQVRAHVSLIT